MNSINKQRIRQRVSGVVDTQQGTQGTSRSIKDYTKGLEKQVKVHTESMGTPGDLARDFGAGI